MKRCVSAETLSEDDDDPDCHHSDVQVRRPKGPAGDGAEFVPTPGGPFSALTASMVPQDLPQKLRNPVGSRGSLLQRNVRVSKVTNLGGLGGGGGGGVMAPSVFFIFFQPHSHHLKEQIIIDVL